ncbi:PLP-dependent transferase [Venustampulla echinocandica]|uniref:PLP-dependent transferase n=1 Tax=Venustampulla echinocandica TaxID=2656787 RepID=A0A370TSP8_9HELO|nr:PLP-dependent transferase [Venustampulla echinocandica]RDL38565.1 PLP-dependent transferase [Venustampulla echinocandica]
MESFDITSARERFPALKQNQVFFDNAGGSQTLGSVIDSIFKYLSETNVQLGGSYAVGKKSTALYTAGYEAAANSSTTQLFRNLSYALNFPEGSELIVSAIDHEANIASWVDIASRQKLVVKWWQPQSKENPKLLASDLQELLSEKTVLVTCTHASNVLGTIHDIKAIADAVHTIPGALLCVDAVAYAPHRVIDVKALGVDFYAFSWYKVGSNLVPSDEMYLPDQVYGPHISMLYASSRGLQAIKSLGHFFNPSATLENKLGLAGASYELLASIPSVVSYFGPNPTDSWMAIGKHEGELQSQLLSYLNGRPDVTIYGERDADIKKRVSTISFTVKGWKSQDVVEGVDKLSNGEVGIRWGAFYSNRLVQDHLGLGSDGIVRVSMVHYNTLEEVKQLIGIFDQVLGKQ